MTDCIEHKIGSQNKGYGQIVCNGRTLRAHRLVYSIFNGPIPDGMEVTHICDNSKCVNPEHLVLGTHKDNMRDKSERNRSGNRKLNPWSACKVQALHLMGMSTGEVSLEAGISKPVVSSIVNGKAWEWLFVTVGTEKLG